MRSSGQHAHLLLLLLFLFACFTEVVLGIGNWGGTEREDWLETQIDAREPRSFSTQKERNEMLLAVRPTSGFGSAIVNNNGVKETVRIANWERYTMNYWYETRDRRMECPMTPEGMATTTDWTVLPTCLFGNATQLPRTVFVHTYMIPHFFESTMAFLDNSARFVLITAGADLTIPSSRLDVRYQPLRGFSSNPSDNGGRMWYEMLNSEKILHWFAENHDLNHPKLSTMPTGMASTNHQENLMDDFPKEITPLLMRNLTIMNMDKTRGGAGQWADRAIVGGWCSEARDYCIHRDIDDANAISHKEYLSLSANASFITCVHGGGVDPSPKAWESILLGTIPILQHGPLDDAYEHFPVAWVHEWSDLFKAEDPIGMLTKWRLELAPYYEEGSVLRRRTLDRLKMSFWVNKVEETYTKEMAKQELQKQQQQQQQQQQQNQTQQQQKQKHERERERKTKSSTKTRKHLRY